MGPGLPRYPAGLRVEMAAKCYGEQVWEAQMARVSVEYENHLAKFTWKRGDKINALDAAMIEAIISAGQEVANSEPWGHQPDARIGDGVVAGACAGDCGGPGRRLWRRPTADVGGGYPDCDTGCKTIGYGDEMGSGPRFGGAAWFSCRIWSGRMSYAS